MKRVTSTLTKRFVSKICVDTIEGIVEPGEYHILKKLSLKRDFVIWETG